MGYPEHLLTDDESIIRQFHPHWRVLLPIGLWIVVGVGLGVVLQQVADLSATIAYGITVAVIVAMSAKPLVDWYAKYYVLTTERIVVRSGILSKHGVEIPLENINNVLFSQSLVERILGHGDVLIESAGSQGQSRLTDIPDPEAFQSEVYRAREDRAMHLEGGSRPIDPVDQIERLADLRDRGAISDEEFEAKKRDLLGRL